MLDGYVSLVKSSRKVFVKMSRVSGALDSFIVDWCKVRWPWESVFLAFGGRTGHLWKWLGWWSSMSCCFCTYEFPNVLGRFWFSKKTSFGTVQWRVLWACGGPHFVSSNKTRKSMFPVPAFPLPVSCSDLVKEQKVDPTLLALYNQVYQKARWRVQSVVFSKTVFWVMRLCK